MSYSKMTTISVPFNACDLRLKQINHLHAVVSTFLSLNRCCPQKNLPQKAPLWGKAGMGGCHDSSTAVDPFTLSPSTSLRTGLSHEGRGNPCPTDRLKSLRTIQPHSTPAADFTTGAATLFGKADSPPTTCCTSSNVSPFVSGA